MKKIVALMEKQQDEGIRIEVYITVGTVVMYNS